MPYDLVVLDAPATGHGVAVLEAPGTFADTARVGRIARQGRTIEAMLTDPQRTAVVAVARPEEMPVNETLALQEGLRARLGQPVSLIVANGLLPDRFDAADERALAGAPGVPQVAAARAVAARTREQQSQLARLRRHAEAPVCTLPFLYTPELARDDLDALSRRLEGAL
jgi:anion-transporting  ArsA/GET3 family ATPase